jgi:hypothetical protein
MQFVLEKDGNVGAQQVRDKASAILNQLPQGIDPPVVAKFDIDASPMRTNPCTAPRPMPRTPPRPSCKVRGPKLGEEGETWGWRHRQPWSGLRLFKEAGPPCILRRLGKQPPPRVQHRRRDDVPPRGSGTGILSVRRRVPRARSGGRGLRRLGAGVPRKRPPIRLDLFSDRRYSPATFPQGAGSPIARKVVAACAVAPAPAAPGGCDEGTSRRRAEHNRLNNETADLDKQQTAAPAQIQPTRAQIGARPATPARLPQPDGLQRELHFFRTRIEADSQDVLLIGPDPP